MEPYLGLVDLFAFSYTPKDWMSCEGQLLQISQYSPLFSLLGTTYGGDGQTTFALPNLIGKEPVKGMHYCILINGSYPQRC